MSSVKCKNTSFLQKEFNDNLQNVYETYDIAASVF